MGDSNQDSNTIKPVTLGSIILCDRCKECTWLLDHFVKYVMRICVWIVRENTEDVRKPVTTSWWIFSK